MSLETTNNIRIKGIRDGLLLTIDSLPLYAEITAQLTAEVSAKREFLRGSRLVLEIGGRELTRDQLTAWQELLANHGMALWAVLSTRESSRVAARELGLATRLPGSQMDLQGNGRPEQLPAAGRGASKSPIPANALVVKETLRSGRALYFEGHIVIMGDVNPGAEVVADGDIMVWGKLRGLVHAGAMGDATAVICALDLSPTQLRIADQIAITPPAKRRNPTPEMALIRNDQIIAEAWR